MNAFVFHLSERACLFELNISIYIDCVEFRTLKGKATHLSALSTHYLLCVRLCNQIQCNRYGSPVAMCTLWLIAQTHIDINLNERIHSKREKRKLNKYSTVYLITWPILLKNIILALQRRTDFLLDLFYLESMKIIELFPELFIRRLNDSLECDERTVNVLFDGIVCLTKFSTRLSFSVYTPISLLLMKV